jgi:DNA invertase Pin-like site-specific DNA recombinase
MKRCIIYVRVSTKEQAEGYSLDTQRDACMRFADEHGWTVVGEFRDAGQSARTADRPDFQRLLGALEKVKPDILLAHKLDRVFRNLEDYAPIRGQLRQRGIRMATVCENFDESPSGRLSEGLHALLAEHYSDNLSQEVATKMYRKVQAGGWACLAPVGYRNVRPRGSRRGTSHLAPDPEQAPHVKTAFKLYATGGWPLSSLDDELYRRGLRNKNGTRLARSKIAKMLKDPVYIGMTRWHDEIHPGIHEPLVSKAIFDKVQEVIKLHNTAGERRRKHTHYLRGAVRCGSCGARLCTMTAKGRFEYFFCLGNHNGRTQCPEPYTPAPDLERQIEALYQQIAIQPEVRTRILEGLDEDMDTYRQRRAREVATWTKRANAARRERDKLWTAYCRDKVSEAFFEEKQAKIEAELSEAEAALGREETPYDDAKELLDLGFRLIDHAPSYPEASAMDRKRWNTAFFKAIYVVDREISGFEYEEPFESLLCNGSISDSLVDLPGMEPVRGRHALRPPGRLPPPARRGPRGRHLPRLHRTDVRPPHRVHPVRRVVEVVEAHRKRTGMDARRRITIRWSRTSRSVTTSRRHTMRGDRPQLRRTATVVGWSGPKVCSTMASEADAYRSASTSHPRARSSVARLCIVTTDSGCPRPRTFSFKSSERR